MHYLRLYHIVILLLISGSASYGFSSESVNQKWLTINDTELSEDFSEISESHISTSIDLIKNQGKFSFSVLPSEENSSEYSKNKAYLISSRFIEPGLGLAEIIFPFHSFL